MISVVREAYEDIKRYRTDTRTNRQVISKIMEDGSTSYLKSSDIKIGDTLLITEGQEFPCDLILLDSSSKGDYLKSQNSINDSLSVLEDIEQEGPSHRISHRHAQDNI